MKLVIRPWMMPSFSLSNIVWKARVTVINKAAANVAKNRDGRAVWILLNAVISSSIQ